MRRIYPKSLFVFLLKLIRLSSLDDRYLKNIRLERPLLIYILIVMLSVLCQFPYLILTLKYLLSNLIDYLLIIYLFVLIVYIVISLLIFLYLCLFPFEYLYQNLNENEQTKSFETFSKNHGEKVNYVESPRLIPTRSISSSGLTVIDYENCCGRRSHPSFEQRPGITNDSILVMH